jgi:uncharacterized protein (DUF697 family)
LRNLFAMATQNNSDASHDFMKFAQQTSQTIAGLMNNVSTTAGETLGTALYEFVEQGTETIGHVVTPIANHPFIQFATTVPGVRWLMAALGQVNVEAVQQEVESLRRTYPQDSVESLAQRVIADTARKAAGIGLAMNFVPPLALMLLAVDLGAIAALQAKMIYRIAALYNFSPIEPARRGEVLAIWGLSASSSGVMKAGLSVVELVPVVGAVIGSASDAALLYGLGQVACRFYEAKQRALLGEMT